jgi:hypothetical protein
MMGYRSGVASVICDALVGRLNSDPADRADIDLDSIIPDIAGQCDGFGLSD